MTTAATATGRTTRTTGTLATTGVAAAAVASVATTAAAATGHAVGISLDMGGEPIPVFGFGMLTAVFSLVGLAIAAVRRRAGQPRRTFIRTTLVLTTLSLVPDALADSAASTKALLMLTHLIAASIVIPAIARRLPA